MLKNSMFLKALLLLIGFYALVCPAQGQDFVVHNQTYICERGVALPVVFLHDKENSYAVLAVDGKLVAMREGNDAKNRLFIALDDQDSYRLHIKGNDAFLSYHDSDQTKNDKVVLQSCQADIAED